jgi:peptide/nickel transport system substrate-binding protein
MILLRALFAAALLTCVAGPAMADDKVLKWAAAGDVQSIDPDTINEQVTNNLNNLVYDALVDFAPDSTITPALATSWTRLNDTTWRVKIRQGVTFHDGTPLTVDDVVFSVLRAQDPTSAIGQYGKALGHPSRVDDSTVEFRQDHPDPLFVAHMNTIMVMSRAWCIAHHVEHPTNYKAKEESYASQHENGSGPFILQSREVGVKTVYTANPKWWGHPTGNVNQIVLTPISDSSTRLAALLSGDVNFVSDPAPQDIARVSTNKDILTTKTLERRVLFIGMDQQRDELLYSNVKGKNPFKDVRVREAIYRALDMDLVAKKIMGGEAKPTGCFTQGEVDCLDQALEVHPPPDLAKSKKLLSEAGYPNGFKVRLNCPNNRYVADAAMCQAFVGMLARVGIEIELLAEPKTIFFPKVYSQDSSMFMYGWGGNTPDAAITLDPLAHTYDATTALGLNNDGRFSDKELDRLIETADSTVDPKARSAIIIQALDRLSSNYYYLPLLRPGIDWLSAKNVKPVITPGALAWPQWFVIS